MKRLFFLFPAIFCARVIIKKVRNRILRGLLQRYVSTVSSCSFVSPFSMPLYLVIGADLFCAESPGVLPLAYHSGQANLPAREEWVGANGSECGVQDDFWLECHTLTSYPHWRNN